MTDHIPYNKPFIVGKELYNIARAVIEHGHLSGDGYFTKQCQAWLQNCLGTPALLTHSCTAALEMAAILADINPGDEVIMPSYTFVSTANAFVLRGGVPVFVDIRPDTLNIDEALIESAVTDKTKAIVPVHYAGVPCAMDEIMDIADRHEFMVIEDAAQALLSSDRGRFLGTIGDMGTLSFHETKNIISGEGGALLINNPDLLERAYMIWEKGTNRRQFFQGQVDKYTWVDIGSSFLPSDMTAAFLYAQLELAETIIQKRREICDRYRARLAHLEEKGLIRLAHGESASGSHNGHIFYIITGELKERSRLITCLRDENIHAVFHYIPLHSSPAGKKYGKVAGDLKHTQALSERVLRLPLYYEMSTDDVDRVADVISHFYCC
ncbi:MAG: dTDP-4-amino-4,6-dideoxygalactose transaminase [Desulfobacter postgatei]|uniref:dTDP-4-amino-4,6-dideoxygalactose transaminase n=1 Tax=Desulfobacter postgatei TaxID=2293 RepID=UPI0023F3672E|nr:dTDP-4-amino-4,6-dideoxygalactose transaminase [Desulfobacter postgatei]MDD4274824.1 dTDP-4-amino-4,6-dideoxygalactose transaminase [Desulfobacter postgatei]